MSVASEERRRVMDREMATVMANHQTILDNQQYVITQLSHQHNCTEAMKREIENMRQVIEDVRDIMATFKVMGTITKWTAVTSAASLSVWHAVKAWLSLR